uniref:Collagen repeat-containing protein n=1 Tax=Borely moumouvirus TaxID=2712067 RepID=A0A6G6AAW6_9VIRU
MVGGGAGGILVNAQSFGGGGAGGAIFRYPIPVTPGQQFNLIPGAGGLAGNLGPPAELATKGEDSIATLGILTWIGRGGDVPADQNSGNGGDGGSTVTPMEPSGPPGGAGGTIGTPVGGNGVPGMFTYSGAGGGYSGSKGGDNVAYTGGEGGGNTQLGGGGGASAFANGGNGATGTDEGQNGVLGSGGGGSSNPIPQAGNGGDGFIRLDFYSS